MPGETPCFIGFYLLGTDALGRDVFLRALQGTGVALLVGLLGCALSLTTGVFLGAVAGYYGERPLLPAWRFFVSSRRWCTVDLLVTSLADIFLCFPVLFLYLALGAVVSGVASGRQPGLGTIVIVVGMTSWMKVARLVRAEILRLKTLDFVVLAKVQGVPGWLIVWRHLLPHSLPPIVVSATIVVAQVILLESALSFIGVGPPSAELASLGNIISDGRSYLMVAPWLVVVPGVLISAIVLALNSIANHVQAALEPRSAAGTMEIVS